MEFEIDIKPSKMSLQSTAHTPFPEKHSITVTKSKPTSKYENIFLPQKNVSCNKQLLYQQQALAENSLIKIKY